MSYYYKKSEQKRNAYEKMMNGSTRFGRKEYILTITAIIITFFGAVLIMNKGYTTGISYIIGGLLFWPVLSKKISKRFPKLNIKLLAISFIFCGTMVFKG